VVEELGVTLLKCGGGDVVRDVERWGEEVFRVSTLGDD